MISPRFAFITFGFACFVFSLLVSPVRADKAAEFQRVFAPPMEWRGVAGKTEGNPFVAGGAAIWRVDRIWPQDPMKADNFIPMPWEDAQGGQWHSAEHEQGGQPAAKWENGQFVLSGRGPWSGTDETNKLPALVFIAPQRGKYTISATVSAFAWDGGGADKLQILVRDPAKKTTKEAVAFAVQSKMSPQAIIAPPIFLDKGQELAFIPRYPAYHQAGNINLKDLKIGFYSAANVKDYVTVGDDGHLWENGKRIRFWGVVSFIGRKPADNAAVAQRYKDMGFNLARVWTNSDAAKSYVKGDNSSADLTDNLIFELQKHGLHIWNTTFNEAGKATADDAAIIADPATAAAWTEAVGKDGTDIRGSIARIWDPRLETIGIARMKRFADHINQYTGKRNGDDPAFAVWELSNEEWWFVRMTGGQWQNLPPFFRNSLIAQWNDWLKAKYGNDDKLRAAWNFLLPGETLTAATIQFTPMEGATKSAVAVNDANPATRAALTGMAQQYTRDDFAKRRGEDVIQFLLDLWIGHKQREHNAVKTWGEACKFNPLLWDTGIGYQIQSQYLHQHADAIAHCTYVTGFHHDPTYKRYPWYSALEDLPRMCWDVPWIEHNRMEGKPYLVYETQIEQPAKYRAEYPMRIAALGAIQDWDGVCWHLFGQIPDAGDKNYYKGWMDVTDAGGHPQGYHFQKDEVQMSAMKAAAEVFKGDLLPPAPNPTKFIYGRKSLLDPASMTYGQSYGESGKKMMPTTYRYGVRLLIDPTREDDEIIGPVYKPRVYEPNPVRANDSIAFDWQKGHLLLDAPGVASYTGFFAQYGGPVKFQNGVVLRDVQIINPPTMPYPVTPAEKYVEFTLTSCDNLPLAKTRKALLSCVSTSFNTDFTLNLANLKNEFGWFLNPGATKGGKAPALVARVAATFDAPALTGMRYTFRDWNMNAIGSGVMPAGKFTIPATLPVFCVEFVR